MARLPSITGILRFLSNGKTLVILGLSLTVVAILSPVVLMSFVFTQSEKSDDIQILRRAVSPDGKFTANYFVRSGGGAAGYVFRAVNVQSSTADFDSEDGMVVVFQGGELYDLLWGRADSLDIRLSSQSNILRQNRLPDESGQIRVNIVTQPPGADIRR